MAKTAERVPLVKQWRPVLPVSPGRPKGSKNKITLLKQGHEAELREYAGEYMPAIVRVALKKALKGDNDMIKLMIGLFISKPSHSEDVDTSKNQVLIQINDYTEKKKEVVTVTAEEVSVDSDPVGQPDGES